MPDEVHPTYLPTEPSLRITDLKLTSSSIRRTNQFVYEIMENHKIAENTLTCNVFLEYPLPSKFGEGKTPKCFAYKGFAVDYFHKLTRFLNEIMREGGQDYGIIYPKIAQVGPEMHIVQVESDSAKINALFESNKELLYFLASENIKISNLHKIENFENSCAAHTIFSYIFGGNYRDSDNIYLYHSGHVVLAGFNHILGFKDPFCEELEKSAKTVNILSDDDLFCTNEIATLLNLDSRFTEFMSLVWQGFTILRKNYTMVMQGCAMIMADWCIEDTHLDALYERLMVNEQDARAKLALLEKCKRANNKKMSSFDKQYF